MSLTVFKYNNINNISYSPIKFKNILIKHFPNYITKQHDTIEFLRQILESVSKGNNGNTIN